MLRPVAIFLSLIFFTVTPLCSASPPPERSLSSSRQFIVYGEDARLRGALCDLAEQSKRAALRFLAGRDDWQTPIVIQAQAPESNRPDLPLAQLRVNQTGAGLKFQLNLRIPAEVDVRQVERELLRAILLERTYRSQPELPPGTPWVEPPEWLLEGIPALASERDDASVLQPLLTAKSGQILTLKQFLEQKRVLLDSPSRTLYRAYAAALVSMLVESPDGRARLAQFVADLDRAPNDPFADLTAHFPALGSAREQVEETWRASVSRLASQEGKRSLSLEETERALAEVLRVKIPTADQPLVYGLEEFARFRRHPAAPAELRRLTTDLILLSGRAHPLQSAVITEYQRIAAQLLRGKAPRPRRLAKLRALRESLRRRADAIADYLNWVEATGAQVASQNFREYLRAAEEAAQPAPRRRDRISVYLDALEPQF